MVDDKRTLFQGLVAFSVACMDEGVSRSQLERECAGILTRSSMWATHITEHSITQHNMHAYLHMHACTLVFIHALGPYIRTDRQAGRQTDRHTYIYIYIYIHTIPAYIYI